MLWRNKRRKRRETMDRNLLKKINGIKYTFKKKKQISKPAIYKNRLE
jgi:hypothetical protein